jgi:hypothetical protein
MKNGVAIVGVVLRSKLSRPRLKMLARLKIAFCAINS